MVEVGLRYLLDGRNRKMDVMQTCYRRLPLFCTFTTQIWVKVCILLLLAARVAVGGHGERKKNSQWSSGTMRRSYFTWDESIRSFNVVQRLLLYRGTSENAVVVPVASPLDGVVNRRQFVFLNAYFATCSLSQWKEQRFRSYDLIALTSNVPLQAEEYLRAAGVGLIDVSEFPMDRWWIPHYNVTRSGFIPQGRTDGGRTSVKFLAWLLIGYERVLVVDADTFWLEDPSHVFASTSNFTAFREY